MEHGWCNSASDYEEAFKYLEVAAKDGSRLALATLGKMYFFGLGCEQDYQKAKYYLELVIVDDPKISHSAYFYLGQMYLYGFGVKMNLEKAKEYYLKSSAYDLNSCAQAASFATIGNYYFNGLAGLEVNHEKSLSYHKKAMEFDCKNLEIIAFIEQSFAQHKSS